MPRSIAFRVMPMLLPAAMLVSSQAGSQGLAQSLPEVEVIGVLPLPGLSQPRDQLPAPVQAYTGRDIERSGAADLSEFLKLRMGSVHVNETQGNPFQPDLNYRGFTASPLLGTPQGLAVYMDGVRLNQPFGDVVSWDLVPRIAIDSVTLLPGSNPLFGLNALGGALSIQTKDGRRNPGTTLQSTLGSNSRRSLELEHGGSNAAGLDWFVAGNLYRDQGWRDDSPSDVKQAFGKLGWHDARSDLRLTLSHANNHLQGNGMQEQRFLERDWRSVYTKPDITDNRSTLLNLQASHEFSDKLSFSGNVYYRRIRTNSFNGDINDSALDQSVYQPAAEERAALAAAGYSGFPDSGATAANTPFPSWRCIAQALITDEPAEKCNGLINRSSTSQRNYGLSGQLTMLGELAGRRNQLTAGVAYDASRVNFNQSSQLGYLNPDRSVTGVNAFGDGVTGGNVDGAPFDTRVNLDGRSRTWSVFATDTLELAERWHLTAAGRYNRSVFDNSDNITPGGGAGSLDGHHVYSRFNPALGITWTPSKQFNAYAGYNEGSRAPSAIELGCADPANPCKLPNAMAGDPPLKQVVARTWEAGLRGNWAGNVRWNAGLFRTDSDDDLLFVADNQSGFGYFRNFGKTRRQGLELGMDGKFSRLTLSANYTLLDATFRSAETVNGAGNSSNDTAQAGAPGLDGNIQISPGDRIPLLPRHIFKLSADYQLTPALSVGSSMQAISGVIARGNENGAHQADGKTYLGPGKTAGYAIFNLGASYAAAPGLTLLAQVNNVFDRQYATAAQLGATSFDSAGNFSARPFGAVDGNFPLQHATFYAPGAPRLFWVGLRYTFDRPGKG